MRSIKKNLAVLVIMAMLITVIVPTWAEVDSSQQFNFSQEAEALHELGLYYGTSTTTFDPALRDSLTREAGAILVLRLFGLEDEAKAMDATKEQQIVSQFKDANQIDSWAVNQIAYATSTDYAGIIAGNPDGTFNPQGSLKGQDLCTLVLKKLGYSIEAGDFSYNKAVEKVISLSRASDNPKFGEFAQNMASLDGKDLINDDFVGFAYYALLALPYKADKDDSGLPQTILGRLVADGKVTQETVNETGIANDVPALAVLSSEPTEQPTGNSWEATSAPEASATPTPETSATPAPEAYATPAPVASVVYAVYAAAVNGLIIVTLNEVPANAPAAADFTVTQALGTSAATPVTVSINNYDASTKIVVLNTPVIEAGTTDQTVVYSVAYQTTAAVLTAPITVVAVFSVSSVSEISGQKIKLIGTGFTTLTAGNLVTQLMLKNTAIPIITYAVSNPVLVSTTEIDLATSTINNTVASVTWTYTPTIGNPITGTFTPDTVAPTLVSARALDATQIELTFSKEMSETGTLDITNYRVMDVATQKYRDLTTQSTITLSYDKTVVLITLGGTDLSNMAGTGGSAGSPFTVSGMLPKLYIVYIQQESPNKVQDLALNSVITDSTATFMGTAAIDTAPPALTNAIYNTATNILELSFNENIKKGNNNVDETKIIIAGSNGSKVLTANDYAEPGTNGTDIDITLSTLSAQAVSVLIQPYTITFAQGAVKDVSLNSNVQTILPLTVDDPPSIIFASYDEGTGNLTLNFNKPVQITASTPVLANITMSSSSGSFPLDPNDAIVTTTAGSELVIALSQAHVASLNTLTPSNTYISYLAGAFADTTPDAFPNEASTGIGVPFSYINSNVNNGTINNDTIIPNPVSATYDDGTGKLQISFNEKVKYNEVNVNNFSVFNGANELFDLDGTQEIAAETTAGCDSSVLTFALTLAHKVEIEGISGYQASTVNLLLEYSGSAVQDEANNYNVANTTGMEIGYINTIPPTVISVISLSPTSIQVEFSERLDPETAIDPTNYTIVKSSNSEQQLIVTSATLSSDSKSVILITSVQSQGYWSLAVKNVRDIGENIILAGGITNIGTFQGTNP